MLCKNENRDPAHCLKEGRRVTRCTTDLWVFSFFFGYTFSLAYITPFSLHLRITKMRENCLQQFDAHWECLEKRNQVCTHPGELYSIHLQCRASLDVFNDFVGLYFEDHG